MSLGKLIFNSFNLEKNHITNIYKVGRNRIKLELKKFEIANEILESSVLKHNNLRAYIPEAILYRKGVINNVDTTFTTEELKENLSSNIKIENIRRITRKSIYNDREQITNTQTVIISFRGQVLPDHVTIYGARCIVRPYVYKVTQCLQCLRFGHTNRQCRSSPRCNNCGENHQTTECIQTITDTLCLNCKGPHKASDKLCPVFEEQKLIKQYMADNNIGYKEAKAKYRTFSRVTSTNLPTSSDFPELPLANKFQALTTINENENHNPSIYPNSATFLKPRRYVTKQNYVQATQSLSSNSPCKPQESHSTKNISIKNPYPPQPHLLQNNQNLENNTSPREIVKSFCSYLFKNIYGTKVLTFTDDNLDEYINSFFNINK